MLWVSTEDEEISPRDFVSQETVCGIDATCYQEHIELKHPWAVESIIARGNRGSILALKLDQADTVDRAELS
jgi:hypothetical protein